MDAFGNNPSKSIKSVQKAFDIIGCLLEMNGATIVEISEKLDIPKSTVHSHLATLRERGYIVKKNNKYYVGLLFLNIGTKARDRYSFVTEVKSKIQRLANETNERAQLMIEEHGRGIYVYRARGSHSVQTASRIGKPRYLHTSAAGKAILAALPHEQVEEIIDQWGLPSLTANTHSTRDDLLTEISEIQERGYAVNREEHIRGLWAIGSVIQDHHRRVLGALSISGPTYRIRDQQNEEKFRDQLLSTINEIELTIQTENQ